MSYIYLFRLVARTVNVLFSGHMQPLLDHSTFYLNDVREFRQRIYTAMYFYNNDQRDALFLNFILIKNSTCFGQSYCPSSGVLIMYSQQKVFVILVMLTLCLPTSLADIQHN
jgi:hypothetical protein